MVKPISVAAASAARTRPEESMDADPRPRPILEGVTMFAQRRILLFAATLSLAGSGGISVAAETVNAIQVLSSAPRAVSEGSALVAVAVPEGVDPSTIRVFVRGTDATAAFGLRGRRMVGLVSGLRLGPNALTATSGGRAIGALTLVNHDRNGPIFSGPQQQPFFCQTEEFRLPDGSTLGPAQDKFCNVATRVTFFYKPVGGGAFKVLPSARALPADVATTTTSDGRTVKFVVRLETGTLNRSVYQSAVLFDPTSEAQPGPLASYKGWNHKIVYAFGGGASAGYRQGAWAGLLSNPLRDNQGMLAKGYAVLGASLDVFQTTANDVVSAETASMVKERFIKTFGAPIYTMGWGGSGGAMQQHLIANNYPGILDGITPAASFPDLQTLSLGVDCALLERAFRGAAEAWTEAQMTAVSGWGTWETCGNWSQTYSPYLMRARQGDTTPTPLPDGGTFDTNNCGFSIPRAATYDPVKNPRGARCDMYSGIINVVGVDRTTGFAARAFDNVGVQYGLRALQGGVISAEQFVELNEKVGGFDNDGDFQGQRTAASRQALKAIYETGRVNEGTNLDAIPIIDNRPDPGTTPNVHDSVRSLIMRARLIKAHGRADNQIILRYQVSPPRAGSGEVVGGAGVEDYVLEKMDEWLVNIRNDARAYPSPAAKVVANKPAGLADACFPTPDERITEPADINNAGRCGKLMPFFSNPRMVAGGPLSDDVMKCHLRPLRPSDYPTMSSPQFARLTAVFPSGVCDYSKPSIGFGALKSSWLAYPQPGVSTPLR